ncbi:hypothetical protein CBR_g55450 [Chara braunii]|uniref:Uncharacterized protein n=1 Tax=Chara braunii TaxID=69332 RepID=A0A388K7U5_CHABU|nr:hypothetical protein CBR_g55450 [Chara braunii]|eukprot:GBG66107.1 hypothetical protein CBR_g55450 [Chara braunii]
MAGGSGGYGGYGYGYGGGLRPCVETLEATIAGIKVHQDAEIAKERRKREEEERIKKENEEEEQRLREKKAREDFQTEMKKEINSKLDITKMKVEIESLRKALRNDNGASSSENAFDKYKRELEEKRARSDRRLAAMEDEIARLKMVNDEAVDAADVWKREVLRPGNKRGSVAVTATPIPRTRTCARVTPIPSPSVEDLKLKEKVEHQEREIELLREWWLRELNGRRQAEQEVDRLKEKMARLEVGRRTPLASNLKTRLDKVATATAGKGKRPMSPATQAVEANDREAFLVDTRRALETLKKEKIVELFAKEGVSYSTLEKTKEELVLKRAEVAFGKDRIGTLKKSGVVLRDVTEDAEQGTDNSTEVNDDSAHS